MEGTRVLLVRHAMPITPVLGTLPHVDDLRDLTAEGRAAAAALGERLRREPIVAIYSSPARRAIATVEPLAGLLHLEIRIHDPLIERWLADRILHDDVWIEAYRRTWDDADFCPDNGESRSATRARALGALDHIAGLHPGRTIVASTHGGWIGCVLRGFDDAMTFEHAMAIPMPAVYVIERRDGAWALADQQGSSYQATST